MDTTNDIRSILLKEWHKLKDTTGEDVSLWDVFISLIKDKVPVYLVTLKADIFILKYIASGLSINTIFQRTGIPSKAVRKVAFTWGLTPLEETLDFNPLLVYNMGMSPESLKAHMDEILPRPVSLELCEIAINNIERYFELDRILREEDR